MRNAGLALWIIVAILSVLILLRFLQLRNQIQKARKKAVELVSSLKKRAGDVIEQKKEGLEMVSK
jgi:hypothetical protein